MTESIIRVYCSGPLFNEKEREEMQEIASALEKEGFETFLPHRDGLEFTPLAHILMNMGVDETKATLLWDKAIFALDAYQVTTGCQVVVVNLNGRVPDEGAVAEAAMAWAAGRIVVGIKDDLRSLVMGRDNAMVTGLLDFEIHASTRSAIEAVKKKIQAGELRDSAPAPNAHLDLGKKLWEVKTETGDFQAIAEVARDFNR